MNSKILIAALLAALLLDGCKKGEAEGEHHEEEGYATETRAQQPANILQV